MQENKQSKARRWGVGAVIVLLVLLFAFVGLEGYFGAGDQKEVARVNGHKITQRELDTAYERLAQMRRPANDEEAGQLREYALSRLIETYVLFETADKLNFYISDAQVQDEIMNIPAFQVDGVFSKERYREALHQALLTDRDLRAEIRHLMTINQLQLGVVRSAFSLPTDLSSIIKHIDQKRDIRYALVSHMPFEKQVLVKEEAVQTYYKDHPEEFIIPEKVKVQYLELSQSAISSAIVLKPEEVQAYFKENKQEFMSEEKVRVKHILIGVSNEAGQKKAEETIKVIQARLAAGESFDALAKQYSADPMSAAQGGYLDWFGRGEMIPEFEKAAFALKTGEVSAPVKTPYGIHLIKLMDHKVPKEPDFSAIQQDVTTHLRRVRAEEKFLADLDVLSKLAFEHPHSLQDAADKLGLKLKTSDFFSSVGGTGVFQHPAVIQAAFSKSVKEDAHNSDVIQLNPEAYMVLRIAEEDSARQKTFEEVAKDIQAQLKAQYTAELTKGLARDVLMTVQQGKNEDATATAHKLEFKSVTGISRTDLKGLSAEVVQATFDIPRAVKGAVAGQVVSMPNGDFVVVLLKGIQDGDLKALSKEKREAFEDGLAQSLGELDYNLIVSDAYRTMTIKKR